MNDLTPTRALGALLALCTALATPAEARTVVLHPVDGSALEETGGIVVGFCDDSGVEAVDVTLNGRTHRVELWDGVFDIDLDWAEGSNTLAVGGQSVSFVADPYAEKHRIPTVHQALLDNCSNCHVLGDDRDLKLREGGNALCTDCHKALAAAGKDHGGAPCSGCHLPHTSWTPALLRAEGNALCASCHGDRTGGSGVAHRAVWDEVGCADCHPVHDPAPQRLGERCGACHAGRVGAGEGHRPVVDRACPTCHSMHAAAEQGQWKPPETSCQGCHPASPDPDHAAAAAECGVCHGIHAAKELPPSGERCRGCHAAILDRPQLHGPDAVGRCEVCHPVHDLRNRSPAVFSCTQCHGGEKLQTGHTGAVVGFDTCVQCHWLHRSDRPQFLPPFQHPPFRERTCGECHADPAFGTGRKLGGPWAALCGRCHEGARGDHGPAGEGQCQACHAPHGSSWQGQLKDEEGALCLGCHREVAENSRSGGRHGGNVACSGCHLPHGGGEGSHLRRDAQELCTGCHPDPTLDLGGVLKPFVHGPLNMAGCTLCHAPHGGAGPKHLTAPASEPCAGCHEGYSPAALAAGGQTVHRPAAEGRCASCHEPHAAADAALLRSRGNRLCTGCHPGGRHPHTLRAASSSGFSAVPAEWPTDGGNLACLGCHQPHTGPGKGLLAKPREVLCKTCHGRG